MIIRPTSRIIACNSTLDRYLVFPNSSTILKVKGKRVFNISKSDVLWKVVDTNNLNLDKINEVSYYHGVLDVVDVVKTYSDMFQTNEMGTSFIATPLKTNLVTDAVTSSMCTWV